MIILLGLTDTSHAIGNFDEVARSFPHMATQACMQVMDGGSQLLTGVSVDELVLTKIGIYRLVSPRAMGKLSDVVKYLKNDKRATTVVMGSEEVYTAFLPFADRVIHLMVKEEHPRAFYGALGYFPDLSAPKYRTAWYDGEVRNYAIESKGFPDIVQTDYVSTGKPHFELKSPQGAVEMAVD